MHIKIESSLFVVNVTKKLEFLNFFSYFERKYNRGIKRPAPLHTSLRKAVRDTIFEGRILSSYIEINKQSRLIRLNKEWWPASTGISIWIHRREPAKHEVRREHGKARRASGIRDDRVLIRQFCFPIIDIHRRSVVIKS